MIKSPLFAFLLFTVLSSCVKPSIEYTDFEWIYYDKESTDYFGNYQLGGAQCEYLLWVEDSLIFVESGCTKRGHVVNKFGEVTDKFPFNKQRDLPTMQRIDTLKKHIWRYNIKVIDSTLISNVEYVSYPIESLNLFSRRLPKREQRLIYDFEGEDYSLVLKDMYSVKDICQYDSKRILISMENILTHISPSDMNYYVVMLDLEKLSNRKFLGMPLP